MAVSREQFLKQLTDSGLLSTDEVQALFDDLPGKLPPKDTFENSRNSKTVRVNRLPDHE